MHSAMAQHSQSGTQMQEHQPLNEQLEQRGLQEAQKVEMLSSPQEQLQQQSQQQANQPHVPERQVQDHGENGIDRTAAEPLQAVLSAPDLPKMPHQDPATPVQAN